MNEKFFILNEAAVWLLLGISVFVVDRDFSMVLFGIGCVYIGLVNFIKYYLYGVDCNE